MKKIEFNKIAKEEKVAIFNAIAAEKGMTPFIFSLFCSAIIFLISLD